MIFKKRRDVPNDRSHRLRPLVQIDLIKNLCLSPSQLPTKCHHVETYLTSSTVMAKKNGLRLAFSKSIILFVYWMDCVKASRCAMRFQNHSDPPSSWQSKKRYILPTKKYHPPEIAAQILLRPLKGQFCRLHDS